MSLDNTALRNIKDKKHSKLQWLVQKMQSPSNSAGPRGAASHLIGIRLHGHLFPLQVWDSAFLSLSQYLLKRLPSNREFSKPFSGQPSVNQKIRLIVLMSFYFQDVVWPKEYANLGKKKSVMLRGWRGQRGGWGSGVAGALLNMF